VKKTNLLLKEKHSAQSARPINAVPLITYIGENNCIKGFCCSDFPGYVWFQQLAKKKQEKDDP
jgi:hypothetical protein